MARARTVLAWKWTLGKRGLAFVSLAVLLAWTVADPFGIQAYYAKAEANLTNRILAGLLAPDVADEIVVLTLDRDAMEIAETTWPAPYTVHAEILEQLLEERYRPRALLVDLLFIERFVDRPIERLLDVLAAYDPTPVFIATTLQQNDDGSFEHGIRTELVELARSRNHIQLVWVPKYSDIRHTDHYHFRAPDLPGLQQAPVRTAAYAIYRRLCIESEAGPWRSCWGSPIPYVPRTCRMDARSYTGPEDCSFDVIWRTRPPPLTTFLDSCPNSATTGRNHRFVVHLETLACPPHSTIPAHLLLYPDPDAAARLILPDADAADGGAFRLAPHLRDKIVVYGTDLTLDADLVVPPTHVPLPGLYFHAMALENLLHYGNGFKSRIARWADLVGPQTRLGREFGDSKLAAWLRHPPGTLFTILYGLLAWAVSANYIAHKDAMLDAPRAYRIRVFLGHFVVAIALLLAMSLFAFWLGLAIAHWIGILLIAFSILLVVNHFGATDKPRSTVEKETS